MIIHFEFVSWETYEGEKAPIRCMSMLIIKSIIAGAKK